MSELASIGLVLGLFVLPKALQRFAIPSAITAFGGGAIVAIGFGWFHHDSTVRLLATIGIVTLFLFAGLEVDKDDLRRDARVLGQHLAIRVVTLAVASRVAMGVFGLPWRPAALVALAVFTPSTGFILSSLEQMKIDDEQRRWIKSKAIASELLALLVLFVVLQSTSVQRLGLATLALAGVIVVLPIAIRLFANLVVPHAPRSEVSFLVIIAVVCAFVTKELGVYYLVGAFVVGVVAQRVREELPAFASEKALEAVEVFAAFFIPFYFFKAGTHVDAAALGPWSFLVGAALLVVAIPVRVLSVVVHRRLALGESLAESSRIGLALCPTLVFTLVLAEILRERFAAPPWLFGALIVYTVVNTLIPGLVLRSAPPGYDTPHVPELEPAERERIRDRDRG